MPLRLLPGVRPHEAQRVLQKVELAATNIAGRGHTGDAILYAYLQWVLDSLPMTRSMFEAGGVDELLLTHRYWHLQSVNHVDLQLAPRLVGIEIDERVAALRSERSRLASEQERWKLGRLTVLDTSALIHGPKLWDWNPSVTLQSRDAPVSLVIPILVIDELDNLKESTKQHTRFRARETLKWVGDQLRAGQSTRIRDSSVERLDGQVVAVHGEVHLHILLDEPGHLRLSIADDEIVDRANDLANLAGREVTLVTDDIGQAYRARLAGLNVSMAEDPIYDVDVQEAARAEKQAAKDRQREAQRARKGRPPAPTER